MLQAGRGAGKTQTGARDAVEYSFDRARSRYAVVAPTQADVRATCFQGESGIISVLDSMGIDYEWQRSVLELRLGNGSLIAGFSAEKPDRLRGPQFHRAWLDEPGSFKDAHLGDALNTTFNNLSMGLRLGEDARMVITGTPKRVLLLRELVGRDDIVITRGSTYDNLANLSPTFAAAILRYEGSTIGRQELLGELIEDVEGALWTIDLIERNRRKEAGPMARVITGVDPAGSTHNETGIVAAGVTSGSCICGNRENLPHAYVLGDWSAATTPDGWGQLAIEAFDHTSGDRIVGERNYGGDMVEKVIRSVRPGVPFSYVTASRGKILRAEPIVALYEQNRIHHIGYFRELEEEMTTYTIEDKWSPNRLDALVWALTELGLHRDVEATLSGKSIAERRI
jgi:phage terminase large subunit-like protein